MGKLVIDLGHGGHDPELLDQIKHMKQMLF